jgi:hypothetical protein
MPGSDARTTDFASHQIADADFRHPVCADTGVILYSIMLVRSVAKRLCVAGLLIPTEAMIAEKPKRDA